MGFTDRLVFNRSMASGIHGSARICAYHALQLMTNNGERLEFARFPTVNGTMISRLTIPTPPGRLHVAAVIMACALLVSLSGASAQLAPPGFDSVPRPPGSIGPSQSLMPPGGPSGVLAPQTPSGPLQLAPPPAQPVALPPPAAPPAASAPAAAVAPAVPMVRSEEHTSELQSL